MHPHFLFFINCHIQPTQPSIRPAWASFQPCSNVPRAIVAHTATATSQPVISSSTNRIHRIYTFKGTNMAYLLCHLFTGGVIVVPVIHCGRFDRQPGLQVLTGDSDTTRRRCLLFGGHNVTRTIRFIASGTNACYTRTPG